MLLPKNIKPITIFIFAFFVSSTLVLAQESSSYWQTNYAIGSIIKHQKSIGHLNIAHPQFASISWHKGFAADSEWRKRYNYPDWGVIISHHNFKNSKLGNVLAVQYLTTYYLLNRNNKNQLNLQIGAGFGYNTHPFDLESNNQNIVMSTHFQTAQLFKLNYSRLNLFNNIGFQAGLMVSHFSNASFKKPNTGINTLFINAGLNYRVSTKEATYPKRNKKEKFTDSALRLFLSLNGGMHSAKAGLDTKFTYYASSYLKKRIGYKSGFQLGVDFFNSQANKDFADFSFHTRIEHPDRKLLDHKQVGIFVGHELFFNKIALETLVGYYIYKPFKINRQVYQKIGFKYSLNSKTAIGLNLKVHLFTAEYLTLGIHHQLL